MKIAVVLLLSDLAARRPGSWSTLPGLAVPILLGAVAAAIIFKQPDLGTAAVFLPVLFALLLAGGARIRHLVLLGMLGLASAGLMFEHLEPYQRERLASFLHPESDIRGRDYNIYQARITLGSGQLWGRALAEEADEGDIEDPLAPASSPAEFSRARLDFLPEAHTDFIFSSLGEQFGFVGCAAVIALYVLFTLFAVIVAIQARTLQGAVMVVGLLAIVLTHVVLNLGMCLSLLPVTGLPLPFVSYGGSSMLTNYVIGGLICNVAARRYEFETTRV
jgi:rod shape determining protein RodA